MLLPSHKPAAKPRILILISHGGGGHKTAGESLKAILSPHYEVEIVNVISEILKPLDPLNRLTKGRFTGEDLYNFFLKRHKNRFIHWMASYGIKCWKQNPIEKAFTLFLQNKPRPDLVISATPFVNYPIAHICDQYGIPFLLIPTDLDGSTFVQGFEGKPILNNVKIALAYEDPEIRKATFKKAKFGPSQVAITGFPVRTACMKNYKPQEIAQLKEKFGLSMNHRTVTLIMGALGGNLLHDHVKELIKLKPKQHDLLLQFNVCVGQNEALAQKISSLLLARSATCIGHRSYLLPSGLVVHVHGYTPDILELMAVSDLIITKTGSCTVNEAIYLGKPLLLDNTPRATARHLWWETFNIPFTEKHKLGMAFTDIRQLHMLIPSLLKYPEPFCRLEVPDFASNISHLVHEMIRG
ncbi:MAG: hypothetical protein JSR58_02910 [Verrucomicrobia bacterium]|nr:hypothetical protein [Verrucomicrobiota bacterium]